MYSKTLYIKDGSVSYERVRENIYEALRDIFPEFDFYDVYDPLYDSFYIRIMDLTPIRNESGLFSKETIKEFKYDRMSFCNPYDVLNEVVQWCDNYLHPEPKQEPVTKIVEKIIKPHHCECCGAPLKKDQDKCEYCGTELF